MIVAAVVVLWVTDHPGFSTRSPTSQETPWSLANGWWVHLLCICF